jgi:hypothetical protein
VLIGGVLGACVGLVCVRSVWSFMVVWNGLHYVIIDSFGDILKVTACDWAEAVR